MKLLAERNGHQRYFTEKQWEVLGTDKYGWVLVPKVVINVEEALAQIEKIKQKEAERNIIGSASQMQAPLQLPNQKPKRRKK